MSRPYAAVFFALDGTLIEKDDPNRAYQVIALPGRIERLAMLRLAGIKLGIVSNEERVGQGRFSDWEAERKRHDALAELDLWGRDVPLLMCYYYERSINDKYRDPAQMNRRIPEPGMLIELAEHFKLSPDDCLYVGDRPEDQQAAAAAGMDYCHADLFFSTQARTPLNDWPAPMRPDRPAGKLISAGPDGVTYPQAAARIGFPQTPGSGVDQGKGYQWIILTEIEGTGEQAEYRRVWRAPNGTPIPEIAPDQDPPPPWEPLLFPPESPDVEIRHRRRPLIDDLARSMTYDELARFSQPPTSDHTDAMSAGEEIIAEQNRWLARRHEARKYAMDHGIDFDAVISGETPPTSDPQDDGRHISPQAADAYNRQQLGATRQPIDSDGSYYPATLRNAYKAHRLDSSENGPLGSPAPPRLPLDPSQAPSPFADGPGDRTVYDANNLPPPIPDDLAEIDD